MIDFEKHTLKNGLKVLCHHDASTPMACVNIMYGVGSRDESPHRTGFAHLFEHLMFSGSVNIPDYDRHVEFSGGENNAFTSNDVTNYYLTIPAAALETAFWLESDRMLGLSFSEKGLEVQKGVVIEEFNQRYLNQPYGDAWLLLRPLAYRVHPYQWPTIGKDPDHIRQSTMEEVKDFYEKHYHPQNAVLSVSGNVSTDKVFSLAEKWFGDIPSRSSGEQILPEEPLQTTSREMEVDRDVPAAAIFKVFRAPGRLAEGFIPLDLTSDILGSGNSSRFYEKLVKQEALFSELSAYVTGDIDPGLFVISGKVAAGSTLESGLRRLNEELEAISTQLIGERELQKVLNKYESVMAFSELSVAEKALSLAYYELHGGAGQYNELRDQYLSTSREQIRETACKTFRPHLSTTLVMHSKNGH